MTIGEVIAKFRKEKDVDSKQMAIALDVSPNYLSLIENNKKSPSPKLLSEIADFLGVPMSALLFQTLESTDFVNKKNQKLFNDAKPVIDKLLNVLISEKATTKRPRDKRRTALI